MLCTSLTDWVLARNNKRLHIVGYVVHLIKAGNNQQLKGTTTRIRRHIQMKPKKQVTLEAKLNELGVTALCLSAEHAAVYLGLPAEHARRIKQLGQAGKLLRVSVGRSFVFPVEGLRKYVAANTSAK